MVYLPKKFCQIVIHRNTTHILDVYCCHKHQQQSYHHENTKICMLIHYMYVDIFLLLTKVIPNMFEHVTTHYQTLETWIGHNAMRFYNFKMLLNGLPYIYSQFSIIWGYLQYVTTHYGQIYKKNILLFFKKNDGNAW